jgi:hypothetical protein
MNCTKDKATLILRRHHNRSNLLVDFQASIHTEVVRMRGRISQVNANGFLFVCNADTVSVLFESVIFEYEECSREEITRREKLRSRFCTLRLWLPIATVEEAPSAATTLPSPLLNITETIS